MGDWSTVALPEVLDFQEGPGIMAADFHDRGVPLIRLAGLKRGAALLSGCNFLDPVLVEKRWSHFRLEAGDVLLSTSASLGEVATVGDEGVGAVPYTGIVRFRPRDAAIDLAFVRHLLEAPSFAIQVAAMGVGSVMKHFGPTHLKRMVVSYPVGIAQQRAIAEVLGALDDKIAANERASRASEALAVALVESASRTTRVADLATQSTQSVAPNGFDEEVAHFSLPSFDDGGRPDLAAASLIKSSKFVIERPAVLISKLNPRIPRVWDVVEIPARMALASTEFVVLHPVGLSTTALWAALRQPSVTSALAVKVSGTSGSHQRVKPAEILHLQVPDPRSLGPGVLQQIESVGRSIHAVTGQCAQLSATRDGLLPLLMSGRLRVKDAEEAVARVI